MEAKTLRRSAKVGPVLSVGRCGCEAGFGGEGTLCATEASEGPLPALVEGALELVDTTEPPDLEFIRLGFKSGVPLAYMNLLSIGSGVEAARRGERRGGEMTFGVELVAGILFPFA